MRYTQTYTSLAFKHYITLLSTITYNYILHDIADELQLLTPSVKTPILLAIISEKYADKFGVLFNGLLIIYKSTRSRPAHPILVIEYIYNFNTI